MSVLTLFKAAYGFELLKYAGIVRRVLQLIREVLTRPVLIVLPLAPETRARYIIDDPIHCHPDLGFILPVSKRQVCACVFG